MELQENGLYIIQDAYFVTYGRQDMLQNKNESRPHFYAIKDPSGLYWMIPLSSQVDNYRRKIKKVEEKRGTGNCIYYHIGVIAAKESAFNISKMFPITPKFVKRSYNVNRIPYIVENKSLIRAVRSKATRYLRLLEQGVMQDTNNVLVIREQLLNDQ